MEILILMVIVGTFLLCLASYQDLKTTEISDGIPYLIIILAISLYTIQGFMINDFSNIIISLKVGSLFLVSGLILHHFSQWGDGDAWILGGIAFLLPFRPLELFFNTIFIIMGFMFFYCFLIAFKKPSVFGYFFNDIKKHKKGLMNFFILCAFISLPIFSTIHLFFYVPMINLVYTFGSMFMLLFGLIIGTRFLVIVEKEIFTRRILTSELREGDFLTKEYLKLLYKNNKLLSKKDIKFLQENKKAVWIKEGVRLIPAFLISYLFTLFGGSLIFW